MKWIKRFVVGSVMLSAVAFGYSYAKNPAAMNTRLLAALRSLPLGGILRSIMSRIWVNTDAKRIFVVLRVVGGQNDRILAQNERIYVQNDRILNILQTRLVEPAPARR